MNNGFIFKNGSIKRMPMENEVFAMAASDGAIKVCKGCGRKLPLSSFAKHDKSSDGHMNECKECRRRKSSKALKESKVNPLEKFTARELMRELKARGYEGVLEYTTVQKINIGDM